MKICKFSTSTLYKILVNEINKFSKNNVYSKVCFKFLEYGFIRLQLTFNRKKFTNPQLHSLFKKYILIIDYQIKNIFISIIKYIPDRFRSSFFHLTNTEHVTKKF